MRRNAEKDIAAWYDGSDHKPLYITGMRGTGKTTLITEFARSRDIDCIYINFETNYDLRKLIGQTLGSAHKKGENTKNIADILCLNYGIDEGFLKSRLLILEELHFLENASDIKEYLLSYNGRLILTDSEYVNENLFDQERFDNIRLSPMTFGEFLNACGKEWYREVIEGHFERLKKIPDMLHNEINDMYADYLLTGGMPAVVKDFLSFPSDSRKYNIEEMQYRELRNIRESIRNGRTNAADQINLFNGIASNLADGSYYFKFSQIRKGTSYTYYKDAVNNLYNCGAIIKTEFSGKIKLYYSDPGLAGCILKSSVDCDDMIYDRCIALSGIAANLSKQGRSLSFWRSKNGAVVEFIIEEKNRRVPVKILNASGKNIRSLHVYEEKNESEEMFGVGEGNFNIMGNIKLIPQYAVFCL